MFQIPEYKLCEQAVLDALHAGYRLIDTAAAYSFPYHVANVTFEPKCRNNGHIHHGGGRILLVTAGKSYDQEWRKLAQELTKGDIVNIMPEVKYRQPISPFCSFPRFFGHVLRLSHRFVSSLLELI